MLPVQYSKFTHVVVFVGFFPLLFVFWGKVFLLLILILILIILMINYTLKYNGSVVIFMLLV